MKHYSKQLISDQQLIALARQAGLCFPDCWALDATEEDQELDQQWIAQQGDARYKQILEESERLRQERLDQLRSFACSIIQWQPLPDLPQIMTNLSPDAQAVLDAFNDANDGHYEDGIWHPSEPEIQLAAALRAAANYCSRDRRILMTIANELEGRP